MKGKSRILAVILALVLVAEFAWGLYTERLDPAPEWTHYITWALLAALVALLVAFFVVFNKEAKDDPPPDPSRREEDKKLW